MKLRRGIFAVVLPLIPLLVGAAALEWLVRSNHLSAWLVPTPTSVLQSLRTNFVELAKATLETLAASAAGFAFSAVIGIAIAIALASSRIVRQMFYPYAVFLQTVPIIAIAPLLVIWIGFDLRTAIASAFIVCVFPVIANTLAGLLSTDPALRDLFRLCRASPFATLFKLRLPFALPSILTGLRVAAGLSVIGAIVGEFITGGGVGGIIDVARTQQDVNKVFACLLLGSLLGIVLFGAVNLASYLLLRRWHASETQ